MKLRPIRNMVHIRRDAAAAVRRSGIIVPATYQKNSRPWTGTVLAVGPGKEVWTLGEDYAVALEKKGFQMAADWLRKTVPSYSAIIPVEVEPGDRVVFMQYTGHRFIEDGDEQDELMVNGDDILAVIEKE